MKPRDWIDNVAIAVIVITVAIAVLASLTGCYVDRVQVVVQTKWRKMPVTCLTLPAPTKPKDVYCYTDFASLPSGSYEECEVLQTAQWAEYGRAAFVWIHNYVEPLCYQAVGQAGGPQ